jgi:tetratricopeptide (TPR) repeat protein
LQRAERAYLAEEYEDAAADYEAALRRIQPQTAAATGDYTSAVFGRALTAVALQDPATARTWFNTGLELALQNNQEAALQQAHTRLEQLLNEQPRLANIGQPYLTLLADELDS